MLRMLPGTFKEVAKYWLKALSPNSISTWAQMHDEFLQQFYPPYKVSKLKVIANVEQQTRDSLYEAWEHMNMPN